MLGFETTITDPWPVMDFGPLHVHLVDGQVYAYLDDLQLVNAEQYTEREMVMLLVGLRIKTEQVHNTICSHHVSNSSPQ